MFRWIHSIIDQWFYYRLNVPIVCILLFLWEFFIFSSKNYNLLVEFNRKIKVHTICFIINIIYKLLTCKPTYP